MDINHTYWEENSNIQHLKYESCNSNDGEHPRLKDEPVYRCCDSNLNFATVACSEDDTDYSQYKKNKISRQDPMSHRIIEKRRRDRMNNCLADLSRLIPADYLKKGRGRIEKTEIIEMAIRHIKYLQQAHRTSGREEADRSHSHEQYRLGYQECMSETMRFLVEVEGYFAREALCVRLINHLQKHCETLVQRERVSSSTKIPVENGEYPVAPSMQSLISPTANVNSTTTVRPQSPVQNPPYQFDNGSQLRDMLTGNVIKDSVRSTSSEGYASTAPLTRIPTPDNSQQDAHDHYKTTSEEYECQKLRQDVTEVHNAPLKPMRTERTRNISENENYSNGVSLYKFKNNIKQRFSQDLNAETNQGKVFKRRKIVEATRRNSVTTETYSSENHSSPIDSSQCSPPSSEMYRISSESENARISPTGSSVSDIRNVDRRTPNRYMHLKPENHIQKSSNGYDRYSPPQQKHNFNVKTDTQVSQNNDTDKTNFNVPIFALHAKGSFYIPLTIDYRTLVPYLQHHNVLDILPNVHNIILHPVTINVNFQSNYYGTNTPSVVKSGKHKLEGQNGWR